MQNRSFIIILAVVAAIILILVVSNSSKDSSIAGFLGLQSTPTESYLESYTMGWSGKVDIWTQSGASVTFVGSNGHNYGMNTADRNGQLQLFFYASDTYTVTVAKTGYKSLTFKMKLPGRDKPLCLPWDTACQQSVPELNNYHVLLAAVQTSAPVSPPPDTTPGTGKSLTVTTDPSYCNAHLFGASEQGTYSTAVNGYTWSALPTGTYTVIVSKTGYESATFSNFQIPGISVLSFTLKPVTSPYSLTIRTNPYGCTVRITGDTVDQTEYSGTLGAVFSNIPQATYTAWVSKDGYVANHFTIQAGTLTTTCSLQSINTLIINTVPGADVQVSRGGGLDWLQQTADENGRTEFSVTIGTHTVSISKSGYYSTFFQADVKQGTNEYTFIPGGGGTPTALDITANKYNIQIAIDGLESKNTGVSSSEVWYYNFKSGTYHLTATDPCGHVIERTFTFPQEHYIYLQFDRCMDGGGTMSYRLTVLTNPTSSNAEVQYYSSKDTGVDGASWFLIDKNTYTVIVSKAGYMTKTQDVTLSGEDKLLIVNLQKNAPDTAPGVRITGPSSAGIRELISFTGIGDREQLSYAFDFGDGAKKDWSKSYVVSHIYNTIGTYTVSVKARNSNGLEGPEATTSIIIQQEYKLFTPQIIAGDTTVGKKTNVTIILPTNLQVDTYYIQAYVRAPNGVSIIPRWTTVETEFSNGTIIGKFYYYCEKPGDVKIVTQCVAMDPLNYKDTEEYSLVVKCDEATLSTLGTGQGGQATGGQGLPLPQFNINDYTTSILVVGALLFIVIAALVVLIVKTKKRRRY